MTKNSMIAGSVFVGAALTAIVLLGTRANAQVQQPQPFGNVGRRLSVHASATVQGHPDQASLQVAVRKTGRTVEEAKVACDQQMAKIDAGLRSIGIKPQDLQTLSYEVSNGTEGTGRQIRKVWSVQQTDLVKIRSVSTVSKVLDTAIASGATNVDQVEFFIENVAPLDSKARKNAYANARKTAEELASAMGVTIVDSVSVSEGGGNYPNNSLDYPNIASLRGRGNGLTMSETLLRQGLIDRTIDLDVVFAVR